jgi:hypothetical protein
MMDGIRIRTSYTNGSGSGRPKTYGSRSGLPTLVNRPLRKEETFFSNIDPTWQVISYFLSLSSEAHSDAWTNVLLLLFTQMSRFQIFFFRHLEGHWGKDQDPEPDPDPDPLVKLTDLGI